MRLLSPSLRGAGAGADTIAGNRGGVDSLDQQHRHPDRRRRPHRHQPPSHPDVRSCPSSQDLTRASLTRFRIGSAIEKKACNGLLLKVNQIGTITESIKACAPFLAILSSRPRTDSTTFCLQCSACSVRRMGNHGLSPLGRDRGVSRFVPARPRYSSTNVRYLCAAPPSPTLSSLSVLDRSRLVLLADPSVRSRPRACRSSRVRMLIQTCTGVAKYNALIRIEDEIKMSGATTVYAGAEGFSVGPKVRFSSCAVEASSADASVAQAAPLSKK